MKKSAAAVNQANRELAACFEPAPVFRFFAEISAIPRESGAMAGISDYLVDFARQRGLDGVVIL